MGGFLATYRDSDNELSQMGGRLAESLAESLNDGSSKVPRPSLGSIRHCPTHILGTQLPSYLVATRLVSSSAPRNTV